ncbi:hypothetical protein KC19_12G067300 [Ceratodon purpureus]|uniref:L-gulonolactone oxidase n=1 Tax=Ceratodon purpureus TaxID=3225 RepID=A0A8T0GA43_CERPU|nr:hypothetical protein KC19_12G067300 [Ceratodon purpureus]
METSMCERKSNVTSLILVAAIFLSSWALTGVHGDAAPIVVCDTTGCTIGNAYAYWPDRIPCHAASVVYPKTEEEIIQAVAHAVKHNLKIKAGSRHSHSMTKLVCPGGDNGIFLSTSNYASIISIDKEAGTVTVQAGTQLQDLIDALAESGLALTHVPYWSGLSVAGLLSTGAHGSSLFDRGSAVHEYVTEMTLVVPAPASENYARVVTLREGDEDLKAARVSLGVLGVISTITLQVKPLFKRSVELVMEDDDDLEERIEAYSKEYEFGDVKWVPSLHKVIYRLEKRVPLSTPGNGVNTRFQGSVLSSIKAARAQENHAETTKQREAKCSLATSRLNAYLPSGAGYLNNATTFTGFPVIGLQSDISTSIGCSSTSAENRGLFCDWDPRIKGRRDFFETAAFVPVRSCPSLIKDVKALRKEVPGGLCNVDLYDGGFLFRFVKQSDRAYLGNAPHEDMADVHFDYYRGYDATTPKLDEDLVSELEQMILYKYGGKPHWGKNRNVAFEGVATKYPEMEKFLEVKMKHDPHGLFSSEWSDAMLGINKKGAPGATKVGAYCALEGLCVCSRDEHCAPEQNYFCRPGRVFSSARVCRHEVAESAQSLLA